MWLTAPSTGRDTHGEKTPIHIKQKVKRTKNKITTTKL